MTNFTDLDKHDLHELFRIYDFAKVDKVDDVVERSILMSQSPEMLFDELYKHYEIAKLPKREELMQQMHDTVPSASQTEILSVIRVTEMKKFSASDALRALRRQMSQVTRATPSITNEEQKSEKVNDIIELAHTSLHSLPSSSCERTQKEKTIWNCHECKAPNKEECKETQNSVNGKSVSSDDQETSSMDKLVSRDVQDWVARVIGDNFSKQYMPQSDCSSTAFMDSLRDGVILHILLQKLHYPSMSDDEIVIPKRTKGFFARDNVSVFLQQLQERYQLHEAELFTNSDLCDGKNDRQVITCLLSLARAAYAHGDTTYLPNLISLEKEIESKKCTVTTEELNKIVADAEAETEESASQQMEQNESCVCDEHQKELEEEEEQNSDDKIISEGKEYKEKDDNITPLNEIHKQESINENAELTEKERELTEEGVIKDSKKTEQSLETLENKDSKREETEQEEIVCKENAVISTTPEQEKECSKDFVENTKKISDIEEETSEKNSNDNSVANQEQTEKQEELSLDQRKAAPEQAMHGVSRVFYVRGNNITREKTSYDTVVSNVNNSNEHNKHQASPLVLMRHPYSVEKPCPTHLLSIKEDTKDVLVPRYHARHWDGIDCLLGAVLSAHYARFPHSPWRFRALFSQPGEYVVYNRRSADKQVVHIRAIHDRLLIHQPQPVANKTRFVYHWVELVEALEQMENV